MRCCGAAIAVAAALLLAGPAAPARSADGELQIAQTRAPKSTTKSAARKAPAKKTSTKAAAQKGSKPAQPDWRFSRARGEPTLVYGIAGEDVLISFSCQPDTGLLRVISAIGSRGVRPGDGVAIRLSNGKKRFEIAGTAFATASGEDVEIGGATRLDAALFGLFEGGETIVVDVPGRRRALPVANAGASANAFQKACTATAGGKPPPAS